MIKYSLGIDISLKMLHACLSVIDVQQQVKIKATRKFANNALGFKELQHWIQKHYKQQDIPLHIIMEATGVYYEQCAMYLYKNGFTVIVVLPNKAKKYLQAKGLKSKNDKMDAKGLAQMGAEQRLESWQPMDDFYYTLRSLTRHHESLQNLKTNLTNQRHADHAGVHTNKQIDKQLNKLIETIDKQIAEIQKAIEDHIASDITVQQKIKGIIKIKGVGLLTVATLLAETNGLLLFKNTSQLVSFAGYDVIENQSGNHKGKTRISKKGNRHIRRILHLPAFNVVRYQVAPFMQLFNRTIQKHHIKMKSYVAVQKKVLAIIYSLWKNNKAFDEDYYKNYTTTDEELMPSSRLSFGEADKSIQINSPEINQGYTRYTTVEVSPLASSRLLQK
ncbi:MAG: IS110 family transposase [Bacteroidota bacterium]|nr:IS110 family transposase [Bacteroidota bacterium]